MISLILALSAVASATPPASPVCAPFEQLALGHLPTKIDPDGSDSFAHVWRVWSRRSDGGKWPLTSGVAPQFRVETSIMMSPDPRSYEVRGTRAGGVWRMQARTMSMRRPPLRWGPWKKVTVPSESADKLDALFSDPCLWQAPPFLAATLPLASGGWAPSFDGPGTYFDVRANGRQWAGMQVSWVLGSPGQLRSTVMAAAFHHPEHVDASPKISGMVFKDERGEQPLATATESVAAHP